MDDGQIHAISAALGGLQSDMRRVLAEQERTTLALDSLQTEHDKLKNRGIGILIGVSLVSSAAGATISKIIARVFG